LWITLWIRQASLLASADAVTGHRVRAHHDHMVGHYPVPSPGESEAVTAQAATAKRVTAQAAIVMW
jgi:hypothetical protein